MFDDPRKSLHRIEDELLDEELEDILYGGRDNEEEYEDEYEEEEEEYEEPPRRRRRRQKRKLRPVEYEDDDEDRYMILPKKKGIKGLVFLAALETIAILAVLGWWLQWLI